MAPEVLEGKIPTVQSDIYALGVCLYQLVVGDMKGSPALGWRRRIDDELLIEDIAEAADGSPEQRISSARTLADRLRNLGKRREELVTDTNRGHVSASHLESHPFLVSACSVRVMFVQSEGETMRILVTGSSGHLGEALMRTLADGPHEAVGLDLLASPYTTRAGSICDADFVRENMHGVDVVMHTATLHKPHVATHARQDFVDTNITGTLTLLEAAREAGVSRFIFTSTTSVLGAALVPKESEPAAWITEDVRPVPKNIYGVTKAAAEDLCHLFHRTKGLPCVVLRTSRFFPELDDNPQRRLAFDDTNLKANEFLHRRLDVVDAVSAHLLAAESDLGGEFRTFILSATSPFEPEHLHDLRRDVHSVVAGLFPDYEMIYRRRGWKMYSSIDRVYVNAGAREVLGWQPHFSFRRVLDRLDAGEPILSNLAYEVGAKGYHTQTFADGPYPLEPDTAG